MSLEIEYCLNCGKHIYIGGSDVGDVVICPSCYQTHEVIESPWDEFDGYVRGLELVSKSIDAHTKENQKL